MEEKAENCADITLYGYFLAEGGPVQMRNENVRLLIDGMHVYCRCNEVKEYKCYVQ